MYQLTCLPLSTNLLSSQKPGIGVEVPEVSWGNDSSLLPSEQVSPSTTFIQLISFIYLTWLAFS